MSEYTGITNIENIPSVEDIIKLCEAYPRAKPLLETPMVDVSGVISIDYNDFMINRYFYADFRDYCLDALNDHFMKRMIDSIMEEINDEIIL